MILLAKLVLVEVVLENGKQKNLANTKGVVGGMKREKHFCVGEGQI